VRCVHLLVASIIIESVCLYKDFRLCTVYHQQFRYCHRSKKICSNWDIPSEMTQYTVLDLYIPGVVLIELPKEETEALKIVCLNTPITEIFL
jgi:hypothetical protein